MKSVPDLADHRLLASSLYAQRVVRRSVVELSLRIFINNILQELLKPKIGNSLYSYTLLEYFLCLNELNRSDNEPKKAVIRLKKSSDSSEHVGEE